MGKTERGGRGGGREGGKRGEGKERGQRKDTTCMQSLDPSILSPPPHHHSPRLSSSHGLRPIGRESTTQHTLCTIWWGGGPEGGREGRGREGGGREGGREEGGRGEGGEDWKIHRQCTTLLVHLQ